MCNEALIFQQFFSLLSFWLLAWIWNLDSVFVVNQVNTRQELIKFYFTNHDINKARIDFPLGLSEFLENNCYINDFILLDYLDSNLMSFFEKYNFHLNQSLPKSKRLNVSSKKYNIYDKETYEMVLKKEKIMLNFLLKNWSINFLDNRSKYEE